MSARLTYSRVEDSGERSEIVRVARTKLKECWTEVRRGAPTPWTFYRMGLSYLYLRKPYPAFAAYAKALQLSGSELVLDAAYDALSALAECEEALTGCEWLRRLLLIGAAGKFQSRSARAQIRELASNAPPIKPPVTIFAGGCKADDSECFLGYRPLVLQAFGTYTGTIISGGTAFGVCSLAGDVQEVYPESIHVIGYIPGNMTDAPIDDRYHEIRRTSGAEFSALEAIQYWCDLISSGVTPRGVKVFGIDGGAISASEYKIALALGASVALLEGSGREAKKIRHNRQWRASSGLLCVPTDPFIIEEFVKPHPVQLDPPNRERLARAIHDAYGESEWNPAAAIDPVITCWEELPTHLRDSNRAQADRIFEKIQRIGYTIERRGDKTRVAQFSAEELDIMAQMEHGRWVIERLKSGWTPGSQSNVSQKVSPYFMAWSMLPEDIKDKERKIVSDIPELLASIGLKVCKKCD